jgi:RNA polymerase sigma-70 factor (ECF subfamily)
MAGIRTEPQDVAASGTFASASGKSFADFEELAMPLFDSLYNFARWLAHNQQDAEDLVQETYRKALGGFASFEPGTNFKAWMFRILKNTFLNSRSSLQHRLTVVWPDEDAPELAVETETPETIFLERSDHQLVQSAIDELPAYFRAPLLLCEVEEMSYQEIATVLSIPIGTVMSRLSRARKAIRASLRDRPEARPSTLAASSRRARRSSERYG